MRPVIFAAAFLAGCWLTAKSPEDYRKALEACVNESKTPEQYEACCIEEARKVGANAADCLIDMPRGDGGAG